MSNQTVNMIQQEHILVCLSSSPSNERIVRTAGRMVKAFGCDFTALYVQTPDRTALSKNDLARLTDNIKLAERLGARIITTHGEDVATQIAGVRTAFRRNKKCDWAKWCAAPSFLESPDSN